MKKNIYSLLSKISFKHIVLFLLLLYLLGIIVPYISHKTVNDDFQRSFQNRKFYAASAGAERAAYLDDNNEALLYRLRMIEEAESDIVLSTFDFNSDQSGKDILAALQSAAGRGVSVRIIADGISGFLDFRHNPWFQAAAAHPNIQIRIYNPVNFLKPWKFQARLHDKYLIIDKKMYLLGGRNTTNLFLGDYSSSKNIDRELFVYETEKVPDSSLNQLSDYFEHIWNLKDSKPYTCIQSTKKTDAYQAKLSANYDSLRRKYPAAWGPWDWRDLTFETNRISLLCNPPEAKNKEPWMWYSLHQLMSQGKQVSIYTPYIICGKEMYQDLESLTQNKTKVEIITNDVAKGANPWGCTDYLNQKKRIWNTNVDVYEFMGKHSCHTKAVVIDDRMSIVGSYNMDMRSTYQDTELMLAVDSPKLNQIIRKEIEKDKTFSKTMTKDGYVYGENYKTKKMTAGKKIFYALLRIVVIPIRRFL